jgi:hypothetical protein
VANHSLVPVETVGAIEGIIHPATEDPDATENSREAQLGYIALSNGIR